VLVSVEVLRKKKADDVVKVSSKCPKVPEKKGAEPMKVSGACTSGGPKWPSVADILLAKFVRLSKGIIPYAIASAATVRIMPEPRGSENLLSDLGSKVGGKGPVYKTMPGAKAMPGAKVVFPSLRSASFRLLGLWLWYLWRGLRNHHRMTRRLRFSQRQVLIASPQSIKLDLKQLRGWGLSPMFLFLLPHLLAPLELRQVTWDILKLWVYVKRRFLILGWCLI
jgi:hypothetical protein